MTKRTRLPTGLGCVSRCDAVAVEPHGEAIGAAYPSMPSRPTTVIIVPVMVAISFASPSAPIA